MKEKQLLERKKLKLPEIINSDLTYYMQFGWKQLPHRNNTEKDERKYHGTAYRNRYTDDSNGY